VIKVGLSLSIMDQAALSELPMQALVEQVLPFRSTTYTESFCEKMLSEGIAAPADLLKVSKEALETKLAMHASFNFIEMADAISLRQSIGGKPPRHHRSRSPRRGRSRRSDKRGRGTSGGCRYDREHLGCYLPPPEEKEKKRKRVEREEEREERRLLEKKREREEREEEREERRRSRTVYVTDATAKEVQRSTVKAGNKGSSPIPHRGSIATPPAKGDQQKEGVAAAKTPALSPNAEDVASSSSVIPGNPETWPIEVLQMYGDLCVSRPFPWRACQRNEDFASIYAQVSLLLRSRSRAD